MDAERFGTISGKLIAHILVTPCGALTCMSLPDIGVTDFGTVSVPCSWFPRSDRSEVRNPQKRETRSPLLRRLILIPDRGLEGGDTIQVKDAATSISSVPLLHDSVRQSCIVQWWTHVWTRSCIGGEWILRCTAAEAFLVLMPQLHAPATRVRQGTDIRRYND